MARLFTTYRCYRRNDAKLTRAQDRYGVRDIWMRRTRDRRVSAYMAFAPRWCVTGTNPPPRPRERN